MSCPPVESPLALLLELTHRCPLRCAYCSNPKQLTPARHELPTHVWEDSIRQAAHMGVLQLHFSGGEPMARPDLPQLVACASQAGLYTNLISSGVMMTPPRLAELAAAGLDHVQLSFQDLDEEDAFWVSGFAGGVALKQQAVRMVQEQGLALTLNFVMTRRNAHRLPQMLDYAAGLGVARCEVANVQYYGWALDNRAALLPGLAQTDAMTACVADYRERYRGRMVIDYVIPDYHGKQPKACMGGWASRFMNMMPDGTLLPCHTAQTIEHLSFPTFPHSSLQEAWHDSAGFNAYRGTGWMPDPCGSCEHREEDFGGCRCQALALTGDASAVDPVCQRSPHHQQIIQTSLLDSTRSQATLHLRKLS